MVQVIIFELNKYQKFLIIYGKVAIRAKESFLKKKMNILYIIIFNNNNKRFKKVTFNNSFDKVFNNLTIGNYGYDGINDWKDNQEVITF